MGCKDVLNKTSTSEKSLQLLLFSKPRWVWSNLSASDIFLCSVFCVFRFNILKILFKKKMECMADTERKDPRGYPRGFLAKDNNGLRIVLKTLLFWTFRA